MTEVGRNIHLLVSPATETKRGGCSAKPESTPSTQTTRRLAYLRRHRKDLCLARAKTTGASRTK